MRNSQLWHDLRQSLLGHGVAVLLVVIYIGVADTVTYLTTQRKPEIRVTKTVGIEFVSSRTDRPKATKASQEPIQSSMPKQEIPKKPTEQQLKKSSSNQLPEQARTQKEKQTLRVNQSVPTKAKQKHQSSVKQKNPIPQIVKNKVKQKVATIKQVQRQASKQSKVTKTAISKHIRLNQSAGEARSNLDKSKRAISAIKSKVSQSEKSPGTLKQRNAQVLGSREVQSTGPKVIDESQVKKTVSALTAQAVNAAPKQVDSKKNQQKKRIEKSKVKQIKDQTLASKQTKQESDRAKQREEKRLAKQEADKQAKRQAAHDQDRLQKESEAKQQAKLQQEKEESMKAEELRVAEEKAQQHLAEVEAEKQRAHLAYERNTIARYGQMIISHIQNHLLVNPGMEKLSVNLKVQLEPSGNVTSVLLSQSSGNASFDRLAINAVHKASPLPLPEDVEIGKKMSVINLVIKPDLNQ